MPSPKRKPGGVVRYGLVGCVGLLSVASLVLTVSSGHQSGTETSLQAQSTATAGVVVPVAQGQPVTGYSVLSSVEGGGPGSRGKKKGGGRGHEPEGLRARSGEEQGGHGGSRRSMASSSSDNASPVVVGGGQLFAPAADKRDLVIGMAKALLEEQLAIFSSSLREHMQPGSVDIVIFMDDPVSARMKDIASRFGVTLVVFDEKSFLPVEMRKYHPSTYRWPMIHDFLLRHQDRYRRVLTADVRDTMFQRDPFASIMGEEDGGGEVLWVFEDDPNKTIGECAWNGGWVKSCFGEEVLQRVSRKKIYCSGISLGTLPAMLGYTKVMTDRVLRDDFAACERNGVDQGMHNVFVHLGMIEHMRTMDQASGMVAHMQATPGRIVKPGFLVVNTKEQPYAIVHQYDRDSSLTQEYLDRYVTWDRSENGTVCQAYRISKGADLLKGTCDLKPAGGVDADMCCKVCDRQEGCRGFAHLRGVCFLKSCNGPTGQPMSNPLITMGLLREREASARTAVQ